MTAQEKILIDLLSEMKEKYNLFAIKAEFESEGASFDEVALLKTLVNSANLGLTVKIGGCEAINDLYELKKLGVSSIVAPMIESFYAFQKYFCACNQVFSEAEKENINFFINIETISGYQNLDKILESKEARLLSGIVLGRSDMTGSLGLGKEHVNSDILFDFAENIGEKCKSFEKTFTVGGNINAESIPFLKKISNIDYFETRKAIFDANPALQSQNNETALLKAFEFERLWLKTKKEVLNIERNIDAQRIKLLENTMSVKTK